MSVTNKNLDVKEAAKELHFPVYMKDIFYSNFVIEESCEIKNWDELYMLLNIHKSNELITDLHPVLPTVKRITSVNYGKPLDDIRIDMNFIIGKSEDIYVYKEQRSQGIDNADMFRNEKYLDIRQRRIFSNTNYAIYCLIIKIVRRGK